MWWWIRRFRTRSVTTGARTGCQTQAARLWVIETQLDEAEWRRRLDSRPPEASTHKMRGWTAMQEMLRQYDGCWQFDIALEHHIVVDTARPVEELLKDVLARIGEIETA
jgi:hypothetical protein